MKKALLLLLVILFTSIAVNSLTAGDDELRLKPYILGSKTVGNFDEIVAATKEKLSSGNFEIAGEYTPYDSAVVIVVTNEELKTLAAGSKNGGFGAMARVSVTQVDEEVQVSYLNMDYIFHLYRMNGSMDNISKQLELVLGMEMDYGSKDGLKVKKLRNYHYMFAMPYFNDLEELGKYDSHEQALQAVEQGFIDKSDDALKVYRIDIPGKEETLFGVGIKTGDGGDAHVMNVVDKLEVRATAHLPYELLVSGKKVYALKGRFRIAASFPDLSMGTFMKIRSAPGSIKDVLKSIAGNE
ncbi:MAG: hypothetical protein DWQ05_02410 [Calditrichaeota bacterium]|nr:MAG: hypothetical protein DWQ05_02410 [Calditrichota bacterium]